MTAADGLPMPQRRWAVIAFSIANVASSINMSIANVALPTIGRELHVDAASSVWVVNAFQLATIVSLLPFSSLADIIGYKRVYVSGLALFIVGSLICTFSMSLEMLILGRVLQGIASGATSACNGPVLRHTYPQAAIGRGIGLNFLVFSTTSMIGPTVAAGVLSVASWHWLFALSIPLGIVALFLCGRFMGAAAGTHHRWDMPSALLNAMAVILLIVGVESLGTGSSHTVVSCELAGALVLGTLLVRRQFTLPVPMLAIDLFYRPSFALAALAALISVLGRGLVFVTLPFYLMTVMGRSQVEAGILLTAWPLAQACTSQISGRLSDRYPAGLLSTIGMAIAALGLLLLALLPPDPSIANMLWRLTMVGAGLGIFGPPNNRAILMSAPPERAGGAGAIQQICNQVGMAVGAALVAVIFGVFAHGGVTPASASLAIMIASGFAAIGAAVSSLRLLAKDEMQLLDAARSLEAETELGDD